MGPTTIQGLYLRTEDGAHFQPTSNQFQLPIWTYIRTEDGNEVLWGPQGLNNNRDRHTLRVEFGDQRVMVSGTAP